MMKSSCFCAPIHEPKFQYGKEFIESYNKFYDDADMFLVFSDPGEHSIFDKLNPHLRYTPIVCNEMNINGGPITHKKWYGINHIFTHTEFQYVAAVDVDSKFIRSVNYDELFEQKYSSNNIFANNILTKSSALIKKIHTGSSWMFSDTDQATIMKIMKHTSPEIQYFWFNDIPLYRRDHFAEFATYINMEGVWKDIDRLCFDHVSYVFFLLLKQQIALTNVEVSCSYGLIESPILKDNKQNNKILDAIRQMKPMWIKNPNIVDDKALVNVFMQIHLDHEQ